MEKKPRLPDGWLVKRSSSYKDRVYYFNERTGASTWTLDEIDDFPKPVKKLSSSSSESSGVGSIKLSSIGGLPKHSPEAKCKADQQALEQRNTKRKWKSEEGSVVAEEKCLAKSAKKVSLKRPKFGSTTVGKHSPLSTDSGHSTLGSDASLPKSTRLVPTTISTAASINARLTKTEPQAVALPDDDSSEAMEIDEVDDDVIMVDIQEVRQKLKEKPHDVCGDLTKFTSTHVSPYPVSVSDLIYIVLDTNVLLSDLKLVKSIPLEFQDLPFAVKFVVPWVVLQELDAFKDERYYKSKNPSLSKKAQLAIKFVHDQLSSTSGSYLQGQTLAEAYKESNGNLDSNDDRILQCCLSYAKQTKVILFTNDVNLRNKAIVNNISAKGREDVTDGISLIISKLPISRPLTSTASKRMQVSNQIAKEINTAAKLKHELEGCLLEVFTVIVDTEIKSVYKELWYSVVKKKPPWSIDDVLYCLDGHWIAVFSFILRKSGQDDVRSIKNFFHKTGQRASLKQLMTVINIAIRLLGSFQSARNDYGGACSTALALLTNLYKQCDEEHTSLSSAPDGYSSRSDPPFSSWEGTNLRSDRPSSSCSMPSRSPCHPPPQSESSSPGTIHIPHTPPLVRSSSHVSQPVPANELPPLELCLPAPSALAPLLTEKSKQEIKNMFLVIWSNSIRFCGMLCDAFGCAHDLQYEKAAIVPSLDECSNFLPRLYPVVCRMTNDLRGVLEIASDDDNFKTNCSLLRDTLNSYNESLDLSEERIFDVVSLEEFCAFCEIDAQRRELRDLLWKMVGVRKLLLKLVDATIPQGLVLS